MNMDPELYSQRHITFDTVRHFVEDKLPRFGWARNNEEKVVLDVGCGPGTNTIQLVVPSFPHSKRIFAVDLLPNMVDCAKKINFHPQVEYSVADIEDWSTVEHWEGQITDLISIHCFHWLKDQQTAFQNVYRLLKHGGHAAFFFVLESPFFTTVLEMQNGSKWSSLFKGIDSCVPDSHLRKQNVLYYKKALENMGFEILHYEEEIKTDVYSSDEEYIKFFASLCVLMNHVPVDQKEEFKKDLFKELINKNGRNADGLPVHRGTLIELVVRKKVNETENFNLKSILNGSA